MTDIEQRARDALNEGSRYNPWTEADTRENHPVVEAMCRQIEAHDATKAEFEAFRREVSEAIQRFNERLANPDLRLQDWEDLLRFILPPPVDPLVGAWEEIFPGDPVGSRTRHCSMLREALTKRGLTITEQNP